MANTNRRGPEKRCEDATSSTPGSEAVTSGTSTPLHEHGALKHSHPEPHAAISACTCDARYDRQNTLHSRECASLRITVGPDEVLCSPTGSSEIELVAPARMVYPLLLGVSRQRYVQFMIWVVMRHGWDYWMRTYRG